MTNGVVGVPVKIFDTENIPNKEAASRISKNFTPSVFTQPKGKISPEE